MKKSTLLAGSLALTCLSIGFSVGVLAMGTSRYNDVPDYWATQYIEEATDLGLMNGYTDGSNNFGPFDTVDRGTLATVNVRLYNKIMEDLGYDYEYESGYEEETSTPVESDGETELTNGQKLEASLNVTIDLPENYSLEQDEQEPDFYSIIDPDGYYTAILAPFSQLEEGDISIFLEEGTFEGLEMLLASEEEVDGEVVIDVAKNDCGGYYFATENVSTQEISYLEFCSESDAICVSDEGIYAEHLGEMKMLCNSMTPLN